MQCQAISCGLLWEDLIKYGKENKRLARVSIQRPTPEAAENSGSRTPDGALVGDVVKADKLKNRPVRDDIVLEYNGQSKKMPIA